MRAAARLVGAELRGGELTGVDGSGATGVYSVCGLAVEHKRGMGDPPGHLKRGFRAWTGLATARGGAARRRKCWRAADGHLGCATGGNNW